MNAYTHTNFCAAEYSRRNKLPDMNSVGLAIYLNCPPEEQAHVCVFLPNSGFPDIVSVP